MNKLYIVLILIQILISGCKTKDLPESKYSQSIDNFNMNIYSSEGKKIFTIESPYSRYDKQNNTFNLRKTIIYLFKDTM